MHQHNKIVSTMHATRDIAVTILSAITVVEQSVEVLMGLVDDLLVVILVGGVVAESDHVTSHVMVTGVNAKKN